MTEDELDLRRAIFTRFAETGSAPAASALDRRLLGSLAEQHVVALDADGEIAMAHPFARPPGGATVTARDGRTWSGNCAWDAFGIAAALGLGDDARIESRGVAADPGVLFHVAVPARHWWDDIVHT